MPGPARRIWVLLGDKQGDNNQLLALAEHLGLPFETRTLRYRDLAGSRPAPDEPGLDLLNSDARADIAPPWPDLVIGAGWRSVPAALHIRQANEGRTMLVRIGNPRCDPELFDLVLTTRQYPVADRPSVRWLPVAMSRFSGRASADAWESDFLNGLARPHLLLVVGGATKYWKLTFATVFTAALRLARRAHRRGGSLLIATSRRTRRRVLRAVHIASLLQPNCRIVTDRPRFPILLADADECFVTADSASMISEAVIAGKPVGIVPIRLTARGKRKLTLDPRSAAAVRRRDLRRFWAHLFEAGLAGTVGRPAQAAIENPAVAAAAAVRELLDHRGTAESG